MGKIVITMPDVTGKEISWKRIGLLVLSRTD